MATESAYERSVSPAEFVASRYQTLDLRPEVFLSKNSILGSPNTIDTDNLPLGQNDKSQYGDDCAARDSVCRSRNEGDRYAMESRFSVEYLHNRPPYVFQVLMHTIVKDLDTRAKSMEEQFKRQQNWNKELQWGIDIIAEGLPRLQALEDTITALEAKLDILMESGEWEK
ncbi:uncharacterized protein N7458_005929 [Penicillium daleae]|uniref:Uncharacterized protein n=1 Tax=Penicillium daleae TaxID=63821 RepID=A0AAD6C5L2_9EURO|nr:uncharacterized protein N7458_005929 [Penicillium daleae]KAJ5449480.1 hypothetical protein N7458_005929 [Penicillium daleae]